MKRTSLHLDDLDLKALEQLAQAETQATGSRVSASQIVRRLIREFVQNQRSVVLQNFGFKQWADERSPQAVIVRDEDGTIRYWSKEAQLIYGWTPKEVIGTRTHNLFKTKFPMSLARIEKETREKQCWKGKLIHRRRDGSLVTVNSRWNIQRNPNNKSFTVIEVNAERPA